MKALRRLENVERNVEIMNNVVVDTFEDDDSIESSHIPAHMFNNLRSTDDASYEPRQVDMSVYNETEDGVYQIGN